MAAAGAVPFVDLVAQHDGLKPELMAALAQVLAEGAFILGPAVEAFEQGFAALHATPDAAPPHAVAVASGTDALHMALLGLGVGPGDEVITTANTWISSAFAAEYVGARSVLADIDPDSLQMSPASLAERITSRTKAVVAVHLFGHPAPMAEIEALCRPRGIAIVEDVAQAPLARCDGRLVGTIGDVACYSFYPSKNLGCCGDGGLVLTEDDALAQRVRSFARYGQTAPFHHRHIGYNSRLDTLQAAILNVKLPHLPAWTAQRRRAAATYTRLLAPLPVRVPAIRDGAEPVHHLFPILADGRDRLVEGLRRRGIMAQIHYPTPIHRQPCYAHLGLGPGALPVTEAAMARILSLPIFPELDDARIAAIVAALAEEMAP